MGKRKTTIKVRATLGEYNIFCILLSFMAATWNCRVKPFICTMPMRLDEGLGCLLRFLVRVTRVEYASHHSITQLKMLPGYWKNKWASVFSNLFIFLLFVTWHQNRWKTGKSDFMQALILVICWSEVGISFLTARRGANENLCHQQVKHGKLGDSSKDPVQPLWLHSTRLWQLNSLRICQVGIGRFGGWDVTQDRTS